MFGFFTNQLNTDDKKLYQKAVDLCKKHIKLERSKTYLEIFIKHNLWPHFTNYMLLHNYKEIFIIKIFYLIIF